MVIWYSFFYVGIYAVKNDVSIGWMSFIMVMLGSFGFFASPFTRHLSFWNKILDKIVKKEEELMKF